MEVSTNITKEDYDQLYHLLRKFTNSGDDYFIQPVSSIFTHLFYGPAYENLLAYSQFYGQRYLLPELVRLIEELPWEDKFKRVVDLGCGRGWLGLGISQHYNVQPVFVDKRDTMRSFQTHLLDLETDEGLWCLKVLLEPTDLIVMCDFLHCIENSKQLLELLSPWPLIILEYTSPRDYSRLSSFHTQLKRYGATAFSPEQLIRIVRLVTGKVPKSLVLDPYLLLAVEGGECSSEKE